MAGKRSSSGTRTGEPSSGLPLPALGLAVGITLALVAWGYLVYLAIDFGTAARAGDGGGWALLILAALGATACLFIGLILVSRITAVLGLSRSARTEARRDSRRATPAYAASPAAATRASRFDPSSWDHTRPPPAGSRRRIVPSASASSSPAPTPAHTSAPTSPEPVPGPAPAPAGPRTPTAAGGRRAAPRNGRIARPSRRGDRPPGGRRAAR